MCPPGEKGSHLRVLSFLKTRTLRPQGAGGRRVAAQTNRLPVCPGAELGGQSQRPASRAQRPAGPTWGPSHLPAQRCPSTAHAWSL